jgi:hypothetical protein
MIRRSLIVAVTLLAAAGCGGGGGSVPKPSAPVTQQQQTPAQTAPASLTILIPNASSSSSSVRRTKYISPSTQSLSFTPANATAIVVPLTPTSAGCTTGANGLTCTINVPLPIGTNEPFLVSTFASTNGTGAALSVATVTQTIQAGQANPIALTLGGVPVSFAVTAPTIAVPTVAATSLPVTVTAKDASGNTIVGAGTYSDSSGNPITVTLTNSDPSGATTLAPTKFTGPGSATLTYDNYFQPVSATISGAAPNFTIASAVVAFAAKPIAYTFSNTDTVQLMFSARSTGSKADKGRRHAQSNSNTPLTLAALLPAGSTSAPYNLGTHVTTQAAGYDYMGFPGYSAMGPYGMASGPDGHLYFTENGTSYGIFDAGTTPTLPAPGSVIAGSATQVIGPIALAPHGIVYAAVVGGVQQINPATGALVGSPVLLPNTFQTNRISNAIAVGPDGSVYIDAIETGGAKFWDVAAFTQTTAGLTYSHSFWCGNFRQSTNDGIFGLAVDSRSNVYASEDYFGTISVVPGSSTGNVLPSLVYSNDNNTDDGGNVIVDRIGNIIWAAYSDMYVYAPSSGSVPPGGTNPANPYYPGTDTTPLQTISGGGGSAVFFSLTFGPGS